MNDGKRIEHQNPLSLDARVSFGYFEFQVSRQCKRQLMLVRFSITLKQESEIVKTELSPVSEDRQGLAAIRAMTYSSFLVLK